MDWQNKNWRKYVRHGDEVISCSEKETQVCAWGAFFLGIVLAVFFSLWSVGLTNMIADVFNSDAVGAVCATVILVPLYIMALVSRYCHDRSIKYVLSEKGVYKIRGWLLKSVTFISYDRITDVHMSRGFVDMICKTGSVHIDTASGNTVDGTSVPELSISGVAEYEEIYDFILSKVK